jgi:hypothetical protein
VAPESSASGKLDISAPSKNVGSPAGSVESESSPLVAVVSDVLLEAVGASLVSLWVVPVVAVSVVPVTSVSGAVEPPEVTAVVVAFEFVSPPVAVPLVGVPDVIDGDAVEVPVGEGPPVGPVTVV